MLIIPAYIEFLIGSNKKSMLLLSQKLKLEFSLSKKAFTKRSPKWNVHYFQYRIWHTLNNHSRYFLSWDMATNFFELQWSFSPRKWYSFEKSSKREHLRIPCRIGSQCRFYPMTLSFLMHNFFWDTLYI